jgi:putative ABC transport system substrate-binding protein
MFQLSARPRRLDDRVTATTSEIDVYRRTAQYADLFLKGTLAGELPIYQASKFNTIINSKSAKALHLDLPPTVLAAADEVIE